MIPLYLMFTKMHWVGTFLPLIVPQFLEMHFIYFYYGNSLREYQKKLQSLRVLMEQMNLQFS